MTDLSALRAQADFSAARAKALFRELAALVTGRDNKLLAFETVREKLRVGGPIYRGVQAVRLDQIVGSVNRYRDFDRAFLPTQAHTADRWRKADDGMHVIAAGLYGLLRQDRWVEQGGSIERWLAGAVRDGRLAPAVFHPVAARVLEQPVDALWPVAAGKPSS